jgi:UDP-glucose 4-epimerase
MNILVTGGAGYIGSHVVKMLGEQTSHNITIIDNLTTGFSEAVLSGELLVADLADSVMIEQIFKKKKFDAVIHFAANIRVDESVIKPVKYYSNNTANAINLIDLCVKYDVNKFIFSSTAAVYGDPEHVPVKEDEPKKPLSPYGMSKLMVERILEDTAFAEKRFRYCVLRYFNVAGASGSMKIGQRTPDATHLIKVACQSALGLRENMSIFGTDYNTPDGTGVRDYIHVDDLSSAHLAALEYLRDNDSNVFNCGYGRGYSVREVIDAVKKVAGKDFKVLENGRRAGDSAKVVADNSKILKMTGWAPEYADLEYICSTAFEWEKKMTSGWNN